LILALVLPLGVAAQRGSVPPRPATPAPAPPPTAPPTSGAKTERPVPFAAGEVLTFDVSWSSYLTAGTATVSVKEKKPSYGSTAYYVVAEGRPTTLLSKLYNLYYKADTLLDAYSLLPQRGSVYSEEGGRRRMKITSFNQGARKAVFEMQTSTTLKKDLALPPYSQDALSAIYVLRALPLAAGGRMTMPVADNGRIFRVQIAVGAAESVKTGIGTVNAVRLTPTILGENGKPEGRAMSLWISDDARRLPVKLAAELAVGSFVLTLRSVTK
jgi:hypothetical protein